MEQQSNNVLLLISGAMLLAIGALVAYLVIPPHVVTVEAPATEADESADEDSSASTVPELPTAPEGYERPLPDFAERVALPEPDQVGTLPVANALTARRSNRSYATSSLALGDLSQMLWAGVGVSDAEEGLRTVPSRGEAYPVSLYVVVDRVDGLEQGLYLYLPETHELGLIDASDQQEVWPDITGQPHPQKAAATILMSADMSRGEGYRHTTYQETGHVGQNLYLQAEERDVDMLVMGGFDSAVAGEYLGLDEYQRVVYLVPMGNPLP